MVIVERKIEICLNNEAFLFFQLSVFDPRFLRENPKEADMLPSGCDSRCKLLIKLRYGLWVSRQRVEVRLIPTPSTTPVPVDPTSPTISTTTIITTTTTSVIIMPRAQPPTLTFWDHLAIFGNYAVSFLVFMGQLASYLYRQYSQVN